MCDCRKEINKKMTEVLGHEGQIVDFELISGRTYSIFEFENPTKKGKNKTDRMPILHSYCPFCGQPYKRKE